MEKQIFKVGDKVYHIDFGWGLITDIDNCDDLFPLQISYNNGYLNYFPIRSVSFTEYPLQGFSQERPIELPEVGELCLVRDNDCDSWVAREFKEYKPNGEHKFYTYVNSAWKQMKRIKILD